MATPFPLAGIGVDDEPPPRHLIEKEKSIVMGRLSMVSSTYYIGKWHCFPQLHFSNRKHWSWEAGGQEGVNLASTTLDQVAMAKSVLSYRGVVEDESPPLHLVEKYRRMVMDQVAMANFPSPYREREGSAT